MATSDSPSYAAFDGPRRVASGPLRVVLSILKERFDRDRSSSLQVFELDGGRRVHFDLRGSIDEVLERAALAPKRGPGRPRLGVTSREVSLLPRHWEWLELQPNGVSAALRRLVEGAVKAEPGKERARRLRAALADFLSTMAGDRPHYEEATRALFAGDTARFEALVERWPRDVRDFAVQQAREAARAENGRS